MQVRLPLKVRDYVGGNEECADPTDLLELFLLLVEAFLELLLGSLFCLHGQSPLSLGYSQGSLQRAASHHEMRHVGNHFPETERKEGTLTSSSAIFVSMFFASRSALRLLTRSEISE